MYYNTGGSNKNGTKTDDVSRNIVYVELYNVDMCDWYGFHHILTKIEWKFFENIFDRWNLNFEFENMTVRKSKKITAR